MAAAPLPATMLSVQRELDVNIWSVASASASAPRPAGVRDGALEIHDWHAAGSWKKRPMAAKTCSNMGSVRRLVCVLYRLQW